MKKYLTWKEKGAIVIEAYSQVKNIKPVARKYSVSPAQIRRWRSKLIELLSAKDITDEKVYHMMSLKMVQRGRPRKD